MTNANPFSGLAQRIRLESEILEKFGELYSCDAEASIELLSRMAKEAGVLEPEPEGQTRVTIADRLRDYFVGIENEWRSFDEIAADTGITKNSIRQVLYKQDPDSFEKRQSPEGGRKVEWRLANHTNGPEPMVDRF